MQGPLKRGHPATSLNQSLNLNSQDEWMPAFRCRLASEGLGQGWADVPPIPGPAALLAALLFSVCGSMSALPMSLLGSGNKLPWLVASTLTTT